MSQFELDNSYSSYKSTEIGKNRWRLRGKSIKAEYLMSQRKKGRMGKETRRENAEN